MCEPSQGDDRTRKVTVGLDVANLQKLDVNVPDDTDYNVWLPLAMVYEVNDRIKNSLYGYFIGKRLAFSIFASIEGVEYVLHNGSWMIHGIPIYLNKWSPSVSLLKKELSHVPVWVKFHNVLLVAYTSDGLSMMATKIVMPVLNLEGSGYTKETIHIEYEWKPPYCSSCLIFGHSLVDCPKVVPKRVVNQKDKGKV
ncbi:zinc knuckle CX2CX4HX4C containing protein [Tanacetum coccineum]|uniref:Zinc knuckle CX2CX4HX4C containing protein n=1 Tax=Tanacetum coccineum TaxID=301880 RepID=A0ABQ5DYA2_9ASTR